MSGKESPTVVWFLWIGLTYRHQDWRVTRLARVDRVFRLASKFSIRLFNFFLLFLVLMILDELILNNAQFSHSLIDFHELFTFELNPEEFCALSLLVVQLIIVAYDDVMQKIIVIRDISQRRWERVWSRWGHFRIIYEMSRSRVTIDRSRRIRDRWLKIAWLVLQWQLKARAVWIIEDFVPEI